VGADGYRLLSGAEAEREIEIPSTSAAGEEPVGDEGHQSYEHDRPQQGGEQQPKQNPK
jgi:hypothetical protein